jgi:hypothetical protein
MTMNATGDSFGWFSVDCEMISTAEARVFVCHHEPAHRAYLLRMSHEEAEGRRARAPQGPPDNADLELPNVRATTAAASRLYPGRYLGNTLLAGSGRIVLPEYYGVLDGRYLLPVSVVYRRRDAIPFGDLLDISSFLVCILPFWENLWLLLISETGLLARGSVAFDVWKDRWQHLIRDSGLGRQLLDDLPADLSGRVGAEIAAIVNGHELGIGPSFDESTIIRLITAFTGGRLTREQIAATLSCPFFRMNITIHDLHYAVALSELTEPKDWLFQSPLEWLGPSVLALPTIISGLTEQPSVFPDDSDAFEQCPPPDKTMLTRFSLFLQDPERRVRPYIALEERSS